MLLFGSDNEALSVGNLLDTFLNYMLESSIHHSYFRFQNLNIFCYPRKRELLFLTEMLEVNYSY